MSQAVVCSKESLKLSLAGELLPFAETKKKKKAEGNSSMNHTDLAQLASYCNQCLNQEDFTLGRKDAEMTNDKTLMKMIGISSQENADPLLAKMAAMAQIHCADSIDQKLQLMDHHQSIAEACRMKAFLAEAHQKRVESLEKAARLGSTLALGELIDSYVTEKRLDEATETALEFIAISPEEGHIKMKEVKNESRGCEGSSATFEASRNFRRTPRNRRTSWSRRSPKAHEHCPEKANGKLLGSVQDLFSSFLNINSMSGRQSRNFICQEKRAFRKPKHPKMQTPLRLSKERTLLHSTEKIFFSKRHQIKENSKKKDDKRGNNKKKKRVRLGMSLSTGATIDGGSDTIVGAVRNRASSWNGNSSSRNVVGIVGTDFR
jgi:hypothetical protein